MVNLGLPPGVKRPFGKTVYSKEELENMAFQINATYFPERLSNPAPFDSYLFLDYLGVEYRWERISPGLQISAMTFFLTVNGMFGQNHHLPVAIYLN